jgi:hypothetical protein
MASFPTDDSFRHSFLACSKVSRTGRCYRDDYEARGRVIAMAREMLDVLPVLLTEEGDIEEGKPCTTRLRSS